MTKKVKEWVRFYSVYGNEYLFTHVSDDLIAQKKAELAALQLKWREINIERINQEKREALAQVIANLPSREESQRFVCI